MVISEFYNITVNNRTFSRYIKLGYPCNPGDNIKVKWTDLPSNYDVSFKCKECNNIHTGKKHILLKQKYTFICTYCVCIINAKKKIQDLTGQKFGRLLVLSLDYTSHGKESYWKVQCDCGTIKTLRSRSIKTGRVMSCGCYSKEITQTIRTPKLIEKNKLRVGEKHHNWNSELTKEDRERKRNVNAFKILSRKTFERDNFTCQCCLQKGNVLNAHHILPYHKHIELRYDINNLITLCKSCHMSYHSKYKKNINQETLNEFKKEVSFVL